MNRFRYLIWVVPALLLVWWIGPLDLDAIRAEGEPWCGTVMPAAQVAAADAIAARGRDLFEANCARCHNLNLNKMSTGPALFGVRQRIPPGDWIYAYVRDAMGMVRAGDAYAVQVWEANQRAIMDPMPHLSDADIDAIMRWIDSYAR